MKVDPHIHSKYSADGVLDPEEIVRIARKKGLHGIAITDHNTIRGGQEAKKYETEDFKVIVGAEIMTEKGEVTGLFLSQEIKSRNFKDVIAEIKAQNGIIVVPHPFDRLRHEAFRITAEYVSLVDCIEVFNSRCLFQNDNVKALEFAARYNLPGIAGSDAHYPNEIGLSAIITQSKDVHQAIIQKDFSLLTKRSSVLNHVRTKILKEWRKISR